MSDSKPNLIIKRPSLDVPEDKCQKDIIEEEEEEEEDITDDLPSFKSVIFKGNSNNDLFYDAEKGEFVNVANFAFANSINHFEDNKSVSEGSSSLALLDSR